MDPATMAAMMGASAGMPSGGMDPSAMAAAMAAAGMAPPGYGGR